MLLALDEVANIAPLQSLPSLVSEGGGRGIVTQWAVQSLAQLRARYGVEQQEAILAATTAKLIFGGLSNAGDLHNISTWAGEAKENQTSYQSGPAAPRSADTLPTMKPGIHRQPIDGRNAYLQHDLSARADHRCTPVAAAAAFLALLSQRPAVTRQDQAGVRGARILRVEGAATGNPSASGSMRRGQAGALSRNGQLRRR